MSKIFLPDRWREIFPVQCHEANNGASTVRAALSGLFAVHPLVARYLLDDAGSLKERVTLFVDGREVRDRHCLSDPLGPNSEIRIAPRLIRSPTGDVSCEALAGWKWRLP